MIEPPHENPRRASFRVIAEMLAQAHPVTAGLAHLYRFTHPTDMEDSVTQWRQEVSDQLNDHEALLNHLLQRLAPRLQISETALDITIWLAETSEDGLSSPVDYARIQESFQEVDDTDLQEACHELEHLGFVSLSRAIYPRPIATVRPLYALFWAFDPIATGNNPTADAVSIAKMMLDDSTLASIPKLEEAVGWPKRQLNPAVARLTSLIPEGRTRTVRRDQYAAYGFSITAEDQFRLKRFIENPDEAQL